MGVELVFLPFTRAVPSGWRTGFSQAPLVLGVRFGLHVATNLREHR